MPQTPSIEITFSTPLTRAVSEPGILSQAYHAFHGYSIGNQLLAPVQCLARGIAPGPIATFMGSKAKGRSVRKGEKALVLCMPVTCKRRPTSGDTTEPLPETEPATFMRFVYRPHWFVLCQTDGAAVAPATTPSLEADVLFALQVTEEPFAHLDGNCQGYTRQRTIAVSPVAELPHKTRFHELAHLVLAHTAEGPLSHDDRTPRGLAEVESEAVALVCLEALGLPGAAHCGGYIQHWNACHNHAAIPERSAQRIFKAADAILCAGRLQEDAEPIADAA
jgi:hypothetical protein